MGQHGSIFHLGTGFSTGCNTYTPFFMSTPLLLGEMMDILTLEQAVQLFAHDGMPARNLAQHTQS